jgi:TPR repeat protein
VTETLVDEAASQGDIVLVLATDEIKSLIDRGRQYLAAGDVAAARLLFNRAANAGDVTAAVAMGTTYDPAVLGSHGVRGLSGDPQRARGWYEKAAELGSVEGLRLLKALDSRLAVAGTGQTVERVDSDEAPGNASFAINRDQGRAVPHDLLMRRQPGPYYKPKH